MNYPGRTSTCCGVGVDTIDGLDKCSYCGRVTEEHRLEIILPIHVPENIVFEKLGTQRIAAWIKPVGKPVCASDLIDSIRAENPSYRWTISSVIVFRDDTSICFIGERIN